MLYVRNVISEYAEWRDIAKIHIFAMREKQN